MKHHFLYMNRNQLDFTHPIYHQSRIPDIIGLLLIFSAGWHLLNTALELFGIFYHFDKNYFLVFDYKSPYVFSFTLDALSLISVLGSIWLIVIGRGLMNYKNWARKQFIFYVIYSQLFATVVYLSSINAFFSSGYFPSFVAPMLGIVFIDPLVNFILAIILDIPKSRNSLF